MRLSRIDEALDACEHHIQSSGAVGTEIEAFLTRYLTVLMCATFEETIEQLVIARAQDSKDQALASFVESAVGAVFRSVKSSEIAGLLGRFGQPQKDSFQDDMKVSPQSETRYNNIVTNRHENAHKGGSNLTLAELRQSYEEGHAVLDAFERALKL